MHKNQKSNLFELLSSDKVLLATVSGAASTKPNLIRFFNDDVPAIDIITTKSFQVTKNDGNREPIICEPSVGTFGNSVGLRNPGMEVAFEELKNLRKKNQIDKILNVSLSASNPQDFITLILKFESVADMVELNFSCPHADSGFGASIGCNLDIAESYVHKIKEVVPNYSIPIFVKLTPNVQNIGQIAKACIDAGADGIVAINTVGPECYIEPQSKKPILNNGIGGKGGKSGLAIFEVAYNAISEIRKAIGPKVPILGMGGVASGEQVAKIVRAGANAVGVGSALARVNQKDWAKYLEALKTEAENILMHNRDFFITKKNNFFSETLITKKSRMFYDEHTIIDVAYDGSDVVILTLDGKKDYKAGEFVFLWLPEIGEKPFTIALSEPLTFMIKKRGVFTQAVFKLKVGDKIYIRGLYGLPSVLPKTKKAFLVAGGTGVAVLPKLAESLSNFGVELETFLGTSENNSQDAVSNIPKNSIEKKLSEYGKFTRIADNGMLGRVLDFLETKLKKEIVLDKVAFCETVFYIVGPTVFFTRAAEMICKLGISENKIYLSLEKLTRCGVGLCGECACGKKLTCQSGTFFRYDKYLKAEKNLD